MMAADDFAFFGHHVPDDLFRGRMRAAEDQDAVTAEPNHSPRFYVDESCLLLGARAMTAAVLDLLHFQHGAGRS